MDLIGCLDWFSFLRCDDGSRVLYCDNSGCKKEHAGGSVRIDNTNGLIYCAGTECANHAVGLGAMDLGDGDSVVRNFREISFGKAWRLYQRGELAQSGTRMS